MMESKVHVPIRTCISCGTKREKKGLIRMILDANGLVVRDDHGRGKGRGAYVCPDKACLEGVRRDRRLGRAFRKEGSFTFHPDLWFE